MSHTKKKSSMESKLPHLSMLNSVISVRSFTEPIDSPQAITPFNQPNLLTPLSTHKRKETFNFRDSGFLSPEAVPDLKKFRKSMPMFFKPESSTYNGKFLNNSGRNFYLNTLETPREEGKLKTKVASLAKKREELVRIKTWDEEQEHILKKILFSFNEAHSKFSDNSGFSSDQENLLAQLLVQIEYGVHNLLVSLSNTIEVSTKSNTRLSSKLSEVQETLKNLDANYKMKHKMEYEKIEKMKKEINQSFKVKEISENSNYMAMQKLKSENDYLQEKLENLLKFQDFNKLNQELESAKNNTRVKTEQYENEIKDRESLIARYEIMYSGTKKMNENLHQVKKTMEEKLYDLNEEYLQLQKSCEKLEEERNMYRERSLMQLADYEALQMQFEAVQESLEKMRDRYIVERQRSEKASGEKGDFSNCFSFQVKAIEFIKNSVYTGPGKHLNFKKGAEKGNDKSFQEIDLKNYLLAKPTYQSLFLTQKLYKKITDIKFTTEFIATIRAIYDSKYNEFLYSDSHTQISRFPDFVYSWMGKFVLDNVTRKVRTADIKDQDPEILRNEMIVLLQTPMSTRLWECITFKEFLDENHTRDELVYFLHCRHLLFKGPQLNDPSSTFIFNYHVKLEWAECVLDQLLGHKHNKDTITLMKSKFKERAKSKRDILLIDSAFFLRVLLEEYKKEKAEKFMAYKKMLSEEHETMGTQKAKPGISFDNFKDFISTHFPDTSDLEKSELYRRCWIYCNGNVDSDSVLMVLNEENFFTKVLKFASWEEIINSKGTGLGLQSSVERMQTYVVQQFNKMDGIVDSVNIGAAQLGVEKILVDLYGFERRIRNEFKSEVRGFHGKDIHLSVMGFFTQMYKLNHITLYLNGHKQDDTVHGYVGDVFSTYKQAFKDLIILEGSEVKEFEMNVKAKKLQKFFKSKLSSWYKLMNFILKNKLKRFYDEKRSPNGKRK